jgi:AcrR family transcriptional regulator
VIADEPSPGDQRLPTGQHGLPADLVARNQRERLIAAMAEVCWEESYAEVAVADIAGRARVSTATFYKCFADKRDCLLVAHEELFGRLLEEVDATIGGLPAGEESVRAAVATCLELLAGDPPTARLLTVEVLAAGPPGSRRHAKAIEELAWRLRPDAEPAGEQASASQWAAAAALAAIIGREVMEERAGSLPELEDELTRLVLSRRDLAP